MTRPLVRQASKLRFESGQKSTSSFLIVIVIIITRSIIIIIITIIIILLLSSSLLLLFYYCYYWCHQSFVFSLLPFIPAFDLFQPARFCEWYPESLVISVVEPWKQIIEHMYNFKLKKEKCLPKYFFFIHSQLPWILHNSLLRVFSRHA